MTLRKFVVTAGAAVALAAAAPAALLAGPTAWQIDPVHSSVSFKVRHLVSQVRGEFTDFTGSIRFDPNDIEHGTVEVTIQTASVNTGNDKRDTHLRSADFLDAEGHPTITFHSTRVRKGRDGALMLDGKLSIRGVERDVSIPFEFHGAMANPMGGQSAGFSAELRINRKDYGVSWNRNLEQGGRMLGEEVAISLEVEAVAP